MSALQIIILTLLAECVVLIWYAWRDDQIDIDDRLSAADDEIRNRPRLG